MEYHMRQFGPASFYRKALAIALPVMLQQLIMSLVSLIDNFMVAGLGDAKMAAINVANQINFVYFVMLWTFVGAGGIYLAQYRGAKDAEGMQQAYRFKVIMALVLSTAHFALCLLIPDKLIAIMTSGNAAQAEIVEHGARYLRLVAWTWYPIALSTAIGTAYREIGKPKVTLVISIVATLINTFGNWLFIYGNLGAPRLEVAGAAIATIIARVFETGAFLVYVRVKKEAFFVPFIRIFKLRMKLFLQILSRSSMMLLSETTWVVSETVMTAIYNGRGGAEVVAGMAAGFTIANIFFLVFQGIHTTTSVILGGALGAGELEKGRDYARWLKSGSLIAGSAVAILALASILGIPLVFGNLTVAARGVTAGLVAVIALYLPIWTLLNAQFAISRAGGDTALGMYVDVSVNTLIFIPGCFIMAWFTPWGPVLMFLVIKSTDILKYFIAAWYLKKEKWLKNLTVEGS